MSDQDIGLMAHLLRRAGFGATRSELEAYVKQGYDQVVEDLVEPERCTPLDEDILQRYFGGEAPQIYVGTWLYRMINCQRPLEEKMALFCHRTRQESTRAGFMQPDRSIPAYRHDQHAQDFVRAIQRSGNDLLAG